MSVTRGNDYKTSDRMARRNLKAYDYLVNEQGMRPSCAEAFVKYESGIDGKKRVKKAWKKFGVTF